MLLKNMLYKVSIFTVPTIPYWQTIAGIPVWRRFRVTPGKKIQRSLRNLWMKAFTGRVRDERVVACRPRPIL